MQPINRDTSLLVSVWTPLAKPIMQLLWAELPPCQRVRHAGLLLAEASPAVVARIGDPPLRSLVQLVALQHDCHASTKWGSIADA